MTALEEYLTNAQNSEGSLVMLKVAAIQMASSNNIEKTLRKVEEMVGQAAKQGALLVVLPEEFATLSLTETQKIAAIEELNNGKIQSFLSNLAKENHIWLVGGTLPIQSPDKEKWYSSCIMYDSDGRNRAVYHKMHLFDVRVGENGDSYFESMYVKAGESIITVETPFATLGLAVCYDVRFPELFRAMCEKGANLFVLPSAFTIETGQVHWELLVRARAVENLSYMIACGQVGVRDSGRKTYGHSMIVGPWGEILSQAGIKECVVISEIDMKSLQNIRERFPALTHRIL